jgi:hypothetical protein
MSILKKLIVSQVKKAAIKEATNKILPMDGDAPKFGKKSKAAAVLVTFAGIATALAEYL